MGHIRPTRIMILQASEVDGRSPPDWRYGDTDSNLKSLDLEITPNNDERMSKVSSEHSIRAWEALVGSRCLTISCL